MAGSTTVLIGRQPLCSRGALRHRQTLLGESVGSAGTDSSMKKEANLSFDHRRRCIARPSRTTSTEEQNKHPILFTEFGYQVLRLCPLKKGFTGVSFLCFASSPLETIQYARLERRTARLSVPNHKAHRIVEIAHDDVAFQRQEED